MNDQIEFLAGLTESLNNAVNIESQIPHYLEEIGSRLGYDSGFYYKANHEFRFFLKQHFSCLPEKQFPSVLDLKRELTAEQVYHLGQVKMLTCNGPESSRELSDVLSELLSVRSFLLIPIVNSHASIIAFLGLSRHTESSSCLEAHMSFPYLFMSTLAGRIKLHLSLERTATTRNALDSIINNMGIDIYVNDFYTHEILYANNSMAIPYGGVDKMIGKVCWQVLYQDKTGPCDYCPQKKLVGPDGRINQLYSWDYQRPFDGVWFRVFSTAMRWVDGRLAHLVSSVDITENKKNEEIIRSMAIHDNLTGLYNRNKLSQDIGAKLAALKQKNISECFIIFFDLDGFKQINDTFGHSTGDELLKKVSKLLKANPLIREHCYRYGGDEFIILCDCDSRETLKKSIAYVNSLFHSPIPLKSREVICNASIGVSHFPYDDTSFTGLIRKADLAMYQAKQLGKSVIRFYNQGEICPLEEYYRKYEI